MSHGSEAAPKSGQAFRTIGEAAEIIGVPQHVLRFWETRFEQLQPLKRGGNRRYYRPADMALLHRIRTLLHEDGLTIRGAQQLLAGEARPGAAGRAAAAIAASMAAPAAPEAMAPPGSVAALARLQRLRNVRDRLRSVLAA